MAVLDSTRYDFLESVREREWLVAVEPREVLANAHRVYGWMAEQGIDADSFLRELAFTKAADALMLDYDVLYRSWLTESPVQQEGPS